MTFDNKTYQREYQRAYYHRNKEKCKAYHAEWRAANRDKASEYNRTQSRRFVAAWTLIKESMGCSRCGYNACGDALHFHHRDATTKLHSPADLARSGSVDKMLDEIDKCDLLCANCHAETHAE